MRIALAGMLIAACGCGADPLGPLPEMASDVADDAQDVGKTAEELIEDPERIEKAAETARDGWQNGPPLIGK